MTSRSLNRHEINEHNLPACWPTFLPTCVVGVSASCRVWSGHVTQCSASCRVWSGHVTQCTHSHGCTRRHICLCLLSKHSWVQTITVCTHSGSEVTVSVFLDFINEWFIICDVGEDSLMRKEAEVNTACCPPQHYIVNYINLSFQMI